MKKNCLMIGVSICAVVLLVVASLTNVGAYQTVQSSNQKIINEEVNQRELLFQTILDIANNNEIQRIILKSQSSREGFFNLGVRFPVFNNPVLSKNQLKQMYLIGLILSKVISKSRIHSMVEQYQVSNPVIQKEISTVIEKDATLNDEITQLSNLKCDCENDNTTYWRFPILCGILGPIYLIGYYFYENPLIPFFPYGLALAIIIPIWVFAMFLQCDWWSIYPP